MLHVLSADACEHFGRGAFSVARIRPGRILGADADPAFGPLSVIDRGTLSDGARVRMHEHRNDEILSWIWRGTMLHEDRVADEVAISSARLMLMNAGRSFWHEESVRGETVEMLQIFVRPRDPDLEGIVQFWDASPSDGWRLVAGPQESRAPLRFRQAVTVFDRSARSGERFALPVAAGLSPWLYLMAGAVRIGDATLRMGQAVSADDGEDLPSIEAIEATTLVLFLVDRNAPVSLAGTISGR